MIPQANSGPVINGTKVAASSEDFTPTNMAVADCCT